MTYRQRREARAARLREWAEKREAKATAHLARAHELADAIPFGQPFLVGHHSEKAHRRVVAKIESSMRRGVDNRRTAQRMASKAQTIENAAERAIYSDDEDAVEKLTERIAGLEAERDRIKAYNKSCRAGKRDISLLDDAQQATLDSVAQVQSYALGAHGEMPAYVSSNLSGTIGRLRKRLTAMKESD